MIKRILLVYLFFLPPFFLRAQSTTKQFWFEYMLNYPFANSFNLENAFTYSTLLGDPKWSTYDFVPTLEWSVTAHIDLLAQTTLSYTNQTESYNTFEVRPALGTRIFFTPHKRIQTRLLLRLEQRNFKNLETGDWDQVYRPRARGEVIIPINKNSYFQDNLWYAMMDVEALFKVDDVAERFANRMRFRIGGGYRLNYNWRFEFLYMLQRSKDTIEDEFETADHVFRFRIKQYLRKSKPSTASGTGN